MTRTRDPRAPQTLCPRTCCPLRSARRSTCGPCGGSGTATAAWTRGADPSADTPTLIRSFPSADSSAHSSSPPLKRIAIASNACTALSCGQVAIIFALVLHQFSPCELPPVYPTGTTTGTARASCETTSPRRDSSSFRRRQPPRPPSRPVRARRAWAWAARLHSQGAGAAAAAPLLPPRAAAPFPLRLAAS